MLNLIPAVEGVFTILILYSAALYLSDMHRGRSRSYLLELVSGLCIFAMLITLTGIKSVSGYMLAYGSAVWIVFIPMYKLSTNVINKFSTK